MPRETSRSRLLLRMCQHCRVWTLLKFSSGNEGIPERTAERNWSRWRRSARSRPLLGLRRTACTWSRAEGATRAWPSPPSYRFTIGKKEQNIRKICWQNWQEFHHWALMIAPKLYIFPKLTKQSVLGSNWLVDFTGGERDLRKTSAMLSVTSFT